MVEKKQVLSQFVVFQLLDNNYALPVEKVIEVLRMVAVTPLPEAPAWLSGVINLRGRIILVMDLRARLGFPVQAPGLNTPIIIVEAGERPIGLMVDSMRDVLSIPEEAITPPEWLTSQIHPMRGIAHVDDFLVLILDLEYLTTGSQNLKMEEILKENRDVSTAVE